MANNFHYAATAYRVFADATHGNDSWDGLTPDTPKRSLGGLATIMNSTRNQAIITGHFKNQIFGVNGNTYNFLGDGITIIEYPGNGTPIWYGFGHTVTCKNIIFHNIRQITGSTASLDASYCKLVNCGFGTVNSTVIANCILYNVASSNSFRLYSSLIFNSYITPYYGTINRCYFNKSCLVVLPDTSLGTYNNYECKFKYGSTYYDNLAAFVAVYPTSNDTEGNKNLPVTFNNFAAGDFSVPADSPLLDTSKWNAGVCGNATKGKGTYFSEGAANWTISQTDGTNDIELVSNEAKLVSGKTVGTITRNATAPIDIGSLQTLKKINYLGLISFASGAGNNIPAINSYTSGQKGYSPVRMTIDLKTAPISLAEAEWDAIPWKEFDLLEIPRTDGVNGSGHPDFDYLLPARSGNIQARYFLVKITLRTTV